MVQAAKKSVEPLPTRKRAKLAAVTAPADEKPPAVWVDVDKLIPWVKNPRKNDRTVEHAVRSIKRFGWGAPIIARQANGEVIGGHTRLKAALKLGIKRVPVRYMNLTAKEAHALALADNKVAEFSSWDDDMLPDTLEEFNDDIELFNATGFDFEDYFADDTDSEDETVTEVSEALRKKWGTRSGQLWRIPSKQKAGNAHHILIGDSTKPEDVARLLGGKRIDFLFTSPPYNVGIQYASHDDTQQPWPEYRDFLKRVLDTWLAHLEKSRLIGWNIGVSPKTHHARQHLLIEECGLEFFRQMVWRKTGTALPLWHNAEKAQTARVFTPNYSHELVLLFSKGSIAKGSKIEIDNVLCDDVFDMSPATHDIPRGKSDVTGGPNQGLKQGSQPVHPAVFPVRLPLAFIKNLSDVDSVIAEPFCGSGSTLIASEMAGRCGYGMEIDPLYAAAALERMSKRGLEPEKVT